MVQTNERVFVNRCYSVCAVSMYIFIICYLYGVYIYVILGNYEKLYICIEESSKPLTRRVSSNCRLHTADWFLIVLICSPVDKFHMRIVVSLEPVKSWLPLN